MSDDLDRRAAIDHLLVNMAKSANAYIEDGWRVLLVPPSGTRVQWMSAAGVLKTGTVTSGQVYMGVVRTDGPLVTVNPFDLRPEEKE